MNIAGKFLGSCLLMLAAWSASAAEEISWAALLPADFQMPAPLPVHDLSQLGTLEEALGDPAVQMEPHAPVVPAMDGRHIRLPGYIVPLGLTDAGQVEEFLLVPYFGACIHVPPPPSNQIVHVLSATGIALQQLYQPFWISGVIRVEHVESELAEAGYRISDASIEPYGL
ncbi:hypothetical protein SAMN05216198_3789 [Halopseudomonas litoralis]|uniref:DUF3299 domain-containing protein n=1 Tax=Halopseudomonas litoralis TaxID=797277 RepID=A0A1H1XZ95_9GAMM|nr:DUF3299 domain-containing protein [Halopseudomonas litoralis]SDT14435.1 hypothetical protein SAMN05216198_3789 [Halopseudomonas litoralis]